MYRYFLDESGHGGDLASSTSLDFSGQPIFALACVGAGDERALVAELERLRYKHRCGAGELKSSALGAKLPAFAADLIQWLVEQDAPIFVELVEKRFFVVMHVVNHLLCGSYSLDEVDQLSRSSIAELLYGADFDAIIQGYLAACGSQSLGDIKILLDILWETVDRSDEDVARDAQLLTMYARDNALSAGAKATDFLPIADESVTGKKVWILPNLQCLTNIYGRINRSRGQGLDGVALVHDVQLQYGKILEDAKAMLEKLAAQNAMPIVPFADYRLRGRAGLDFAAAADEPCLQAADIVAGCMMRFARGGLKRTGRADDALRDAFSQLFDVGNPFRATGINLVTSDQLLDRLGVTYVSAAPFVRSP